MSPASRPRCERCSTRSGSCFPEVAARARCERNPEEPYRQLFKLIAARVRATRKRQSGGYEDPAGLLRDLRVAERGCSSSTRSFVADDALRDVIRQVEVFGFHFAPLDVREHADVHRAAIAEILGKLGVQEGYAELPEPDRIAILAREIADRRPLIPLDIRGFSASTREVVETFRTIYDLLRGAHPGAIGSYIVSGTTGPRTCSRCCCS